MIDRRLLRVGIEVNGRINYYGEDFYIRASGTKYANPQQNDCTVSISGLSAETRNKILTDTSPFNPSPTPRRLIVEAGRESYGYFQVFIGDIVSAEPSPPPDVELVLKAKTENAQAQSVGTVSFSGDASTAQIADGIAASMGLGLQFDAQPKLVKNFSYTGGKLKSVNELNALGDMRVFIDDGMMHVVDKGQPVKGRSRILNMNSGMVGLPRETEKGIEVTFLVDRESYLGGVLEIESKFNPAVNGAYIIDQLSFDLSLHDDSFFYTAQCSRY